MRYLGKNIVIFDFVAQSKDLWYLQYNLKVIAILVLDHIAQPYLPLRPPVQATLPRDASPSPPVATVEKTFSLSDWSQQRSESFDALCVKSTSSPPFFVCFDERDSYGHTVAWIISYLPILIRIKILAAFHLFCLFCCLFLWIICCSLVIICPSVTDKKKNEKNHTGGREMRPKLNTKTAGQAAVRRPWKVGLYKALQKPWETLSQYIKDTVCSSSLLFFLLPSSSSFSPDYSLFIFLLRLFSSSSTRLLSVSSFTLLFRFFFFFRNSFLSYPT